MILACKDAVANKGPKPAYPYLPHDQDGPSDPADETIASSHYEAAFSIAIDQATKEVMECKILREILDNGDFVIQKNISGNSTMVRKKMKTVRLPFVYDKDFADFDFNKLLTISNLLK